MVCLCYDKEHDRLYKGYWFQKDVLFESYSDKGYRYNRPEFIVPNSDFKIKIESNFGYGNSSYLRASMSYKDVSLLNFENWIEYLNGSFKYFEVEPQEENFEELFDRIIEVYNKKAFWNNNSILRGIEQLEYVMKCPTKIIVRRNVWDDKSAIFEKANAIKHLSKKIEQIICLLDELELENCEQFYGKLDSVYVKFIKYIYKLYEIRVNKRSDFKDERLLLERCFDVIYQYLKRNNKLNILFQ